MVLRQTNNPHQDPNGCPDEPEYRTSLRREDHSPSGEVRKAAGLLLGPLFLFLLVLALDCQNTLGAHAGLDVAPNIGGDSVQRLVRAWQA